MRRLLLFAAFIATIGLFAKKGGGDGPSLNRSFGDGSPVNGITSGTGKIKTAAKDSEPVNQNPGQTPGGGNHSLNSTPVESGGAPVPRQKTDQELLADAQRIHAAILMKYEGLFEDVPDIDYGRTSPESGDAAHTRITVATGEFNGQLIYTMNSNGTSPEARAIAEDLGYTRLHGSGLVGTDSTHAEQIIANALERGDISPPGTIAPSREYCDLNPSSKNPQNCYDTIANLAEQGIRAVPFQEVWP